jgi:hypothetical protein
MKLLLTVIKLFPALNKWLILMIISKIEVSAESLKCSSFKHNYD